MTDTKLTPDELTEWLAVNVMGWERKPIENGYCWFKDGEYFTGYRNFTPTTDLNHTKMVWDALSYENKCKVIPCPDTFIPSVGEIGSWFFDPEKLCRAIHAVCKGE